MTNKFKLQDTPKFLYKIAAAEKVKESQGQANLRLDQMDNEFIHLATKEQLPRILEKFWPERLDAVILKLDVSKLQGNLVKERNPGGSTEYFHLYDGAIPLDAIVEVQSHEINSASRLKG